jgi:plastocyanin
MGSIWRRASSEPDTLLASLIVLAAASSPDAAARTYQTAIDQLKFGPLPPALKRGDTIRWINRDLFRHSVTARGGSVDLDLLAGKTGIMLKQAGTIRLFCKYHPGMAASLIVTP